MTATVFEVCVAGGKFVAARAAADRGIPAVHVAEGDGWAWIRVGSQHGDKVRAWYADGATEPEAQSGECVTYRRRPAPRTAREG